MEGESEDATAWALTTAASVMNLIALESCFALTVYPLYQVTINGTILALVMLDWRFTALRSASQ
jgi:hypothetical protein